MKYSSCNSSFKQFDGLIKFIFFIINPIFAFLLSVLQASKKSSYFIFLLFGILFAWVMDYHGTEMDFCRIVNDFYQENLPLTDFLDEVENYWEGESKETDLYIGFLYTFTHLFSDNYHLLFTFASFPFLYFMLGSLKFITNDREIFKDGSVYFIILLLLFVLPYNIFFIEAPRFPTAVWLNVYSICKIFIENKRRYILLMALSPLIHSGTIIIFLLVVGYLLIPFNKNKLSTYFYITLPLLFIQTDWIFYIDFSFLPDSLSTWISIYLSEDTFKKYGMYSMNGSGFFWVGILFKYIRLFAYIIGVILLIKINKEKKCSDATFNFVLFFFVVVNVLYAIPVLGGRIMEMSMILFTLLWFKYATTTKYRNYLYLFFLANLYQILYTNLFYFSEVLDIDFIFSNSVYLIIKNLNVFNYDIQYVF